MAKIERRTVDLSGYPDMVIIYLGMRIGSVRGLPTAIRLGMQIDRAAKAMPDGLLLHEGLVWSVFPLHLGMRQYWRDFAALEAWTRLEPHRGWWQQFLRDPRGTGFWHETYFVRGGVEAIYDGMKTPVGLAQFAPTIPAHGSMFSARKRMNFAGDAPPAPVAEDALSR